MNNLDEQNIPQSMAEAAKAIKEFLNIKIKDSFYFVKIRLLKATEDTRESVILGRNIIDEMYYRVLTHDSGDAFRNLSHQRGDIQKISRVAEHIHANLEKKLHVDDLARMANMSKTSFFETFKHVMNIPPLQYIKSTRLHKA